MYSAKGLLLVIFSGVVFTAFFSIPSPVAAIETIRHWANPAKYIKLDLCTQPCYSQIVPGLYLSNAKAACDLSVLHKLNITHVLTIEQKRLPKSTFQGTNISTLFIRADDTSSTNILQYFPMCNSFIEEGITSGGNVLVHCHFGVSRSASLVIAYIMQKYELSFDMALTFVRQRRRFVNPNTGFVAQLKEYERMNYDVNGFRQIGAYVNVNARKHKYKIASVAAVTLGVILPIAVLVG